MSRHRLSSRLLLAAGLVVCAAGTPVVALSTAVAAPASAAQTATGTGLDVATYLEWETVADPQLSPDGTQVLYTRRWVNKMTDTWDDAVWIMDLDGERNRFLVEGRNARWSPDGRSIAYLAPGDPVGTQIFVRWIHGGATSQITRVVETPGNLRWSPDGTQLAFTMRVAPAETWKIDLPKPPAGAKWTDTPRHVRTSHYRKDRAGFVEDGYLHLFVVPADGGSPRQLTEGDWNIGARAYGIPDDVGLEWMPDGRHIVFDGLRDADADRRYRESHLYALDVESRAVRQITSRKGPWTTPVPSPDGRKLAFLGYEWTPQTYKADELWLIDFDGTDMRRVSSDLDRDPMHVAWSRDGRSLLFNADDRGSRNVWQVAIGGKPRQLTRGEQMLTVTSVSSQEWVVGTRSTAHEPGDVVAFRIASPNRIEQLTHVNDDVLAGRQLAAVEELWYESTGGTRVQGWLVKPPGFDSQAKYPLILHIHGGPHSMYGVGFNYSFQNLAANGYLVLYTNPRGSTGYGTAFGNAIDNDYPSVDYDDLMAGVDAVMARGFVDASRLYVTGVSGGGVLSAWIISHNNRFAAAAVRAPVIDWISFAGTTDITSWGFARFQPPYWQDPRRWLDHSPLMHVENVRTPVLLMTGELDLRTPIGQTEQYYQALRQLGVPAEMLRFAGEYHGTASKPSNFMRTQQYLLSWFERWPSRAGAPVPGAETTRR
jgi:dipeptidyl aminopeptidase/acylaminoacyl peptidase